MADYELHHGKYNIIAVKSKAFAIRIVGCYNYLCNERKEYIISKQLMRSGTSIGANVRESFNAQSTADFCNKMNIALKEADETLYWLEILHETGTLEEKLFHSIYDDCVELVKLLTTIVKSNKEKGNKNSKEV